MPMPRPRPSSERINSITVYINNDPKHWKNLPQGDNPGKYLKHPFAITQFDREGKAVWPNDQFTHRRVRDNDVMLEAPKKPAERPAGKAQSKT